MAKVRQPQLDEVFGIRAKPVKSYFSRTQVDGVFADAINSDHHIVVYGSSKQGKTALLQEHVKDTQRVTIRCSPRHTVQEIYMSILRQVQIAIDTFETTTQSKQGKASFGFKAKLPWVSEAKTEAEGSRGTQIALHTDFIAYDFSDAQAISELLVNIAFTKYVVLENFHYLPEETQRQLAFDLKTFHEVGVRFIILGIWQEANLLMTHNGDLQDRVIEIPVEPWHQDDFRRVALLGAHHLNIEISDDIIALFSGHAYGNIGMMQEFLKHLCLVEEVREGGEARLINSLKSAEIALDQKLTTQRSQLIKSLQSIAASSRIRKDESDPLLLPYYLVIVVLRSSIEKLREGIDKATLLAMLRDAHHRENKDTVRSSDVTNLLTQLRHYQENMQPPLLYYDNNARRLKVVDTRQFFVLAKSNRDELEDEIPSPLSLPEQIGE